ncbi:Putative outer membrane protein [Croceitalea dokdonensis DOKDO 023]|uniref:Putative outer membrane protein n=1 Tax=Croceitalea dokdonensis DOKDO 023 TaxID=1300341 RepID=A0A0P7AYC0_9FLAO|nr:carboxypeptidase-like regulatory domain-containing protein [Croceitalea dokdonensis]KPM33226.1 Putative outer membrane protein [Croceitalea dokdonensis DOKDO 023]
MKRKIQSVFLTLFMVGFVFAQEAKIIKGKVTDGKAAIAEATIEVLDKETVTSSDKQGNYIITANVGDKIRFSYLGMKTVTIKVEDITRILNPVLVPDITELNEVTVQSSKRISQKELAANYNARENIIRTAFGYIDAERAAGSIRFLQEKDIRSVNLGILELLQNRFPGVQVFGSTIGARDLSGGAVSTASSLRAAGPAVFIRGFSSVQSPQPAIFDIDGQVFVDVPIWLDVNNIKRLAILNNLATTTQYGALGAGGVVVVNTFSGNSAPTQVVDQARLRNNFYKNDALSGEKLRANWPTYKKELYGAANLDEAKMVYQKYADSYSGSPYFVMDVQEYFVEMGNTGYADAVVSDNFGLFSGNPVLLKGLAYQYEAQGNPESANELYKEVFLLRPNYAQSYMDMAKSYRDIGSSKLAAAIFARYGYLLEEGFMEADTVNFAPILSREINNLLALEGDAVLDKGSTSELYVGEENFKGTRLVFEWNDSEAEFDLQFVNPEKQFSLWKYSLADTAERVNLSKEYGYSMMEELIDGSLPGTWQVNVRYHGNKSLTPTYLKATVYHNYGEVSQRKEVKVFKLTLKDVNQELFRVQTTKGVVMR